jgi:hypothetical protein
MRHQVATVRHACAGLAAHSSDRNGRTVGEQRGQAASGGNQLTAADFPTTPRQERGKESVVILLKVYYSTEQRADNNPEYVLTFPNGSDVDTVTRAVLEREYERQSSTDPVAPEELASWFRAGVESVLERLVDTACDLRLTPPVLIIAVAGPR